MDRINLKELIAFLDSTINCNNRACYTCESIYGIDTCPQREFIPTVEKTIRILEKYTDGGKVEISEEELIHLLT